MSGAGDAGAVTLFVPCYVDVLSPRAGRAAVRVLEALGHAVRYRPEVVCCGQPLTNAGCGAAGDRTARRWLRGMAGAGEVVVLSSSCWSRLRAATDELDVAGDPDAPRIREFCEFLDARHPRRPLGALRRTVCLHSACHGLREGGIDERARSLLARVEDLRLVRAARSDECCGFGGVFSVSFPDVSIRMGRDRLDEIRATGAAEVTATDVSCLRHLTGIARARGWDLPFRHVAELLDEAMGGAPATDGGRP